MIKAIKIGIVKPKPKNWQICIKYFFKLDVMKLIMASKLTV